MIAGVFGGCLLYSKDWLVHGSHGWLLQEDPRKFSSGHSSVVWKVRRSLAFSSSLSAPTQNSSCDSPMFTRVGEWGPLSWWPSLLGRVPSKLHSKDRFTLRKPPCLCHTQEWTDRLPYGCGLFAQLCFSLYPSQIDTEDRWAIPLKKEICEHRIHVRTPLLPAPLISVPLT